MNYTINPRYFQPLYINFVIVDIKLIDNLFINNRIFLKTATLCAIIIMDNGMLVPNSEFHGVNMEKNTSQKYIILASASPRRREILSDMGARFEVLSADADETCGITDPARLTVELACRKGLAVRDRLLREGREDGAIIISADTVVCCDGKILGKPRNHDEAKEMLTMLSGRTHTVATGVAVTYRGKTYSDCSITEVRVDEIPDEEMEKYIASNDPFDKAGGYGIQGRFSKWISGIDGCYFGVVGLPVNLLSRVFYRAVGCYPDEV